MRCLVVLCLFVASTYAFSLIDPNLNSRVVGGSNAPDGEYPHQASIQWRGSHMCGGSIIGEEWVMTAAHCLVDELPNDLQVVAGSNILNTGGDVYQVLEIHGHEDFDPGTGLNDVGLLMVEKIALNMKVNKIAVETEDVGADLPVTLSGWGKNFLEKILSS